MRWSYLILSVVLAAALLFTLACGRRATPTPEPTPTALVEPTAEAILPSPTPEPTATPTSTPEPTIAPTATPEPTLDPTGCTLGSRFLADVTIPDNTPIAPGQTFTKTWRLRNEGTCPWGPGYRLAFVEEDRMGGPDVLTIPRTEPGQEVDISVVMVAPMEPGPHIGRWQMCVGTECFGQKVYVKIVTTGEATEAEAPEPSGGTAWITHEGLRVRVSAISWDARLGNSSPGLGEIYLSLYIVGANGADRSQIFNPLDFAVIDPAGGVHGVSILVAKAPQFELCSAEPGGQCEGWWTTQLTDRPDIRRALTFRWQPNWLEDPYVVPLTVP